MYLSKKSWHIWDSIKVDTDIPVIGQYETIISIEQYIGWALLNTFKGELHQFYIPVVFPDVGAYNCMFNNSSVKARGSVGAEDYKFDNEKNLMVC